jgi:uncharacterized protein YjdB
LDATDMRLTWTSSKKATATVDANGLVTAVGNGTTTITATSVDGAKTASCIVTVSTTGIEEMEGEKDVAVIYPNPAENEFFVKISKASDNEYVDLSLYNSLSNMVMTIKVQHSETGGLFRFDTSALSNGVYFLRITKGNEVDFKKIIISK